MAVDLVITLSVTGIITLIISLLGNKWLRQRISKSIKVLEDKKLKQIRKTLKQINKCIRIDMMISGLKNEDIELILSKYTKIMEIIKDGKI